MKGANIEIEIPKYEEQGQTRGRKPTRQDKGKGKGGKRSKGPKNTKGRKVGGKRKSGAGKGLQGKRKAKVERVRRASKGNLPSAGSSTDKPSKKRKSKGKGKGPKEPVLTPPSDASAKGSPAEEEGFSIPDDAIEAPQSTSGNSIYSSAYRKAQKLGGTSDDWRRQGQHASWLFRTCNKVAPSLSGMPRQPKSKNEKNDEWWFASWRC